MSKPPYDVYRTAAYEMVKWSTGGRPATGRAFTEAVDEVARSPRLQRMVDVVWQAAVARRPQPPPSPPPPPAPSGAMRRLARFLRTRNPQREITDPANEAIRIIRDLSRVVAELEPALDDITRGEPPQAVAFRGSPIEEWLTWQRDNRPEDSIEWGVLDDLLRDYQAHADRGRPLTERTTGMSAVLGHDGGMDLVDVYQVAYRAAYGAVLPFVGRRELAVFVCDRIVPGVAGIAHRQPRWCRRALLDGEMGERSRWRAVSQVRFRSVAMVVSRECIDAALVAMARALLDEAEDANGESDRDGKVEA